MRNHIDAGRSGCHEQSYIRALLNGSRFEGRGRGDPWRVSGTAGLKRRHEGSMDPQGLEMGVGAVVIMTVAVAGVTDCKSHVSVPPDGSWAALRMLRNVAQ